MTTQIFSGTIPALMTPCKPDRTPDFDALLRKAQMLIEAGMSAVVYCDSMGDWPLLTDAERMAGVERLVAAGIPVMVLKGHPEFALQFNESDALTDSQRAFAEAQLKLFDAWYAAWSSQPDAVQTYAA